MKIDQDLRAAIRSAEKSQPSTDWQKKRDQEKASIAEFIARCPGKAAQIQKLINDEVRAEQAADTSRELLCKRFGLRNPTSSQNNLSMLEFSNCGKGSDAFAKAGGKLPKQPGVRRGFDAVMAELAAAEPKQLTAIIKKYGINWK